MTLVTFTSAVRAHVEVEALVFDSPTIPCFVELRGSGREAGGRKRVSYLGRSSSQSSVGEYLLSELTVRRCMDGPPRPRPPPLRLRSQRNGPGAAPLAELEVAATRATGRVIETVDWRLAERRFEGGVRRKALRSL